MAFLKCKMCGGDLNVIPGESVAECEYCGSRQTVPAADNEKKLTLFARANRLRLACEFDKAAGVYETIVAEFPEEAEAYWGLILCRYGIEYVDDPATGKKIPTCHRSSFDSVMEDSDFEQACENADVLARRVYRDEAKAIEELRKGILEVSGKEEPYDIFICYKETDETGDRTIDSVIAQDVYDALTEKGYRVFFSRISLEDKLGTEYEPYIFAALNSTKVMLVFGTDYEYFNAVWVKNEWSRFLKLMAADKSKHLIPCYKGIDAYDMPKEFTRLQAQDMGKVGAIQDLLRGIEKILGKSKEPEVKPEPVVFQSTSGATVDSLLKRGNLFLEDGDWNQANIYFDKVLDIDPECAEAYVGKALAAAKCVSLTTMANTMLDSLPKEFPAEKVEVQENTEFIHKAIEQYEVPGYYDAKGIDRAFHAQVFQYLSSTGKCQQQQEEILRRFRKDTNLSRAKKFSTGNISEQIERTEELLAEGLATWVVAAIEKDEAARKEATLAYWTFLDSTEKKIKERSEAARAKRESFYQYTIEHMETAQKAEDFDRAYSNFEKLQGYRDADMFKQKCMEQQAILKRQENKEKEKKKKLIALCILIAVILVVAVLLITQLIVPQIRYLNAEQLLESGDYDGAAFAFELLGDYRDSEKRINDVQYAKAEALIEVGDYVGAVTIFESLGDYSDALDRVNLIHYAEAEALLEVGDYEGAQAAFEALGSFMDSQERKDELTYDKAVSLYEEKQYIESLSIFEALNEYKDSKDYVNRIISEIRKPDSIAAGEYHTVGLKEDGTVVATGTNTNNQCDVSAWSDIVSISAGWCCTAGLKKDGTVVSTSSVFDFDSWTDIVKIAVGDYHVVGLRSDGTVLATVSWVADYGQGEVATWANILSVAAGGGHTVGLKEDGSVVAIGQNEHGECDVSTWSNIISVAAGEEHTVGLRADGTVIATGSNENGECDVSTWSDIIAIAAGGEHTVGLKSDGTVVATGANNYGELDVSGWSDLVAVATGEEHTVGLKNDGTVVAIGNNDAGNFVSDVLWYENDFGSYDAVDVPGQCEVSSWKDIKVY